MFYYITICLYIPFGVLPLPCLYCLSLPSELQTYAVLLFSCVDLQLPACVRLQLFLCHTGGFFFLQSCNFTQVMCFEEWILTFSSTPIIRIVLLLIIITICICSLYWYLTVLPFPARPFLLCSKTEISLWCCQLRRFMSTRTCFQ